MFANHSKCLQNKAVLLLEQCLYLDLSAPHRCLRSCRLFTAMSVNSNNPLRREEERRFTSVTLCYRNWKVYVHRKMLVGVDRDNWTGSELCGTDRIMFWTSEILRRRNISTFQRCLLHPSTWRSVSTSETSLYSNKTLRRVCYIFPSPAVDFTPFNQA
jgi:hypothetical protein